MNKEAIPVLGIPIVNGFRWVDRLIKSIDYPIENVIIMNNGNDPKLEKDLDSLVKKGSPYVSSMKVVHFPSNMGVPFAWNFIIKSFLMEPYWIISNHDVAFMPGLLEEMHYSALIDDVHLVHPNEGLFKIGTYDLFLITEKGVQEIGLFDENLYPAYGEDSDFIMRSENLNSKKIMNLKNKYLHGDNIVGKEFENLEEMKKDYNENGQNTKKEDPSLSKKLENVNYINYEYLNKKWGDHWRRVEPYRKPFAIYGSDYPNTYTTWDLEYVRTKYLGF